MKQIAVSWKFELNPTHHCLQLSKPPFTISNQAWQISITMTYAKEEVNTPKKKLRNPSFYSLISFKKTLITSHLPNTHHPHQLQYALHRLFQKTITPHFIILMVFHTLSYLPPWSMIKQFYALSLLHPFFFANKDHWRTWA